MPSLFSLAKDLTTTKVVLENGLTVIINEDTNCECFDLCYLLITINIGSNNEPPGKKGLEHLYEHLSFRIKPSNNLKSFYDEMNQLGANFGASTSYDTIKFYCKFPKANLEKILELESIRISGIANIFWTKG